ncbi:sigma-70 family RNA polymerase sigma factor [Telmatospirillum sp.]|uniref:RNA polymerase sigma factor n=1 Tax=Telmatospirillum sp. TaxID=2079197 RepID=UPI002841B023|nr:sigma-70 family RNA polymerase sigma factor [Telmatospirillum sp.]MDR3437607.1 sigma-70 family RNA polymerase sigma factor [Telmatospirillum sp.]
MIPRSSADLAPFGLTSADVDQGRERLAQALSRDRHRLTHFVKGRLFAASEVDAEDVVSDLVLRLFERADLLAQVENVTAYLFRALGNAMTDVFRRRRDMEELSLDHADPAATPDIVLETTQLRSGLSDALDRLSEAERAVWVAVELEGWTFRELAERWDEPIGTLLSRKNRATKTLRKALAADGWGKSLE